MVRTQIYLPEYQLAKLKQIAYQNDSSVAEVIRQLLDEKLKIKKESKKKKYKSTGEWLLSMAKEAEKLGVKGPRDLASNMDEYLYGGKK